MELTVCKLLIAVFKNVQSQLHIELMEHLFVSQFNPIDDIAKVFHSLSIELIE
jgi:hypothetical protein